MLLSRTVVLRLVNGGVLLRSACLFRGRIRIGITSCLLMYFGSMLGACGVSRGIRVMLIRVICRPVGGSLWVVLWVQGWGAHCGGE